MLGRIVQGLLTHTPIGLIPVRVRKGPARGARWTLGPFSANWRQGGAEQDVEAGARYLETLVGKVFWDFGAHFGIHTVGKALQVGPLGQVVSFEPDPVAFRRLKRHVDMNHLTNVVLIEAAASSSDGKERMFMLQGGGSSNSHFAFHAGHEPTNVPSQIVSRVTADSLVESGKVRPLDLIKVDVQGHGQKSIAGAAKTIEKFKPVIVFSNHSWEEREGVQRLLQPLGYTAKAISGETMAWEDISECVLVPL